MPPFFSRSQLACVTSLLALLLPGGTIRGTPVAPEATVVHLAQIEEATAINDRTELATLVANAPPAPAGPSAQAYHLALIRAHLDLGQFDAALQRYFNAGAPPAHAWLAGIAFCYKRNWERVTAAIQLHAKADPGSRHPAIPFLEALRAHLRASDYALGDPQVDQLRQLAQADAAAAVSPAAQKHPGFDARFFRLALLVAAQSGDSALLARAATDCNRAFPRHPGYARMAREAARDELAAAFAELGDPETKAARLAQTTVFSSEEIAIWRRVLDTQKVDYPTLLAGDAASFQQIPVHPELLRCRLVFLRIALRRPGEDAAAWMAAARGGTLSDQARTELAAYSDHSGPALRELSLLYAQLAAATGSYVDARVALSWLDLLHALPSPPAGDWTETELQLAAGLNDHPRRLRLILALAPAHASDAAWLNQHRRFMAQVAPLNEALHYLRRLEQLQPDDPELHLALAGLASRPGSAQQLAAIVRAQLEGGTANPETDDTSPLTDSGTRIAYYERAFAQVPHRLIPDTTHWKAYRELLCDQDRMLDFANTGKMGQRPASTPAFDRLVERCHLAKPGELIVATEHALLQIRRAQASPTTEHVQAARAALRQTEDMGPDPATYRAARTQLTQLEKTLDEKSRLARLEARDRANQATTQSYLAPRDASSPRLAKDPEKLRIRFDARTTHVRLLPQKISSYTRDAGFYGASTLLGKNALAAAEQLTAEQGNYCSTCKGVGAFRGSSDRSITICFSCGGTGKKNPSGPGDSAGFE